MGQLWGSYGSLMGHLWGSYGSLMGQLWGRTDAVVDEEAQFPPRRLQPQ